jgi:beta-N-acetylhexosaminidase
MADAELNGVAQAMSGCQSIYAAAFVTVAAYRGSVALEGGLNNFLQSLIKGPAPVALISLGNPYLLRYFPDVSGYAATFSPAAASEIAAARAIFGEISIQGRMPVSIPGLAKVGDGIQVSAKLSAASQRMK